MPAYKSTQKITRILTSLGIPRKAFKASAAYNQDTAARASFFGTENVIIALQKRNEIEASGLICWPSPDFVMVTLPRLYSKGE